MLKVEALPGLTASKRTPSASLRWLPVPTNSDPDTSTEAFAPNPLEVSIGHALISRALFVGLDTVVREYLAALGVETRG